MQKRPLDSQKGFTLIEIIAVLVILGVLAAIAVPKFFEMQRSAEAKTLLTVKNDLLSRTSNCFAKSMLSNKGVAVPAECNTFTGLGLSSLASVNASYTNFAGTFAWADGTITYTYKNSGPTATATFTVAGGSSTTPPVITFANSV